MESVWEEDLKAQLERIERVHQPGKWSGDPRELEQTYDELSTQLEERFKQEQRAFLEGYERREVDARSAETVAKLEALQKQLTDADQIGGAAVAIRQVREDAVKSVAEDEVFQNQKYEVAAELGDRYEAMLNRAQEHQQELMGRNGLMMSGSEILPPVTGRAEETTLETPRPQPANEQDPRRARAEKLLARDGSVKPSHAPSPHKEHEHEL